MFVKKEAGIRLLFLCRAIINIAVRMDLSVC